MVKTEHGNELKSKLVKGITALNDSVSSTLGPGGRNVIICDYDGNIKITKDGVSVAKSFTKLEDPVEDIGVQMLKKVSEKSADKAGDGTTTSTLLASVMVTEGVKAITQGSNAVEVKRGMDKALAHVKQSIKHLSRNISSEDQIRQVATISANNDTEVGNMVATALDKVGSDGVVAIEESKSGDSVLETVEGMMFNRGYKSPYFVTNQSTMQAVLESPYVFLYDGKITGIPQVLPVLQAAASTSSPLLIVADDIEGEALALLVVNKTNNTIKVCAVKAPDFGERRLASLEDMAVLTGGIVVSPTKGYDLSKMKPEEVTALLGKARMVTVTAKDTTIIDGRGEEAAIQRRIEEIKTQLDMAKSPFEVEKLQERLSKLIGGVAILHVGGNSEVEMKEKKDRVDDALHATKAAIEKGIVPGGGMALVYCATRLSELEIDNVDQKLGVSIVKKSLYAPFETILKNSGVDDPRAVLATIRDIAKEWAWDNPEKDEITQAWFGMDVKNEIYGNLLEMGIIDPAKVTSTAVENAISVASTIITTESVVYPIGEPAKKQEIDYSQFMQ